MTELNEYRQREKDAKQALADEIGKFHPAEIREDENNDGHFIVIMLAGGREYLINRDYNGIISVCGMPWRYAESVSNTTRYEIEKKHRTSDKMKVLTAKKLAQKIAEQDNIRAEIEAKHANNLEKIAKFEKALAGLPVKRSEDGKRGWIDASGLEFSYEICEDGYIDQKIRIEYTENALENFKRLAGLN